MRSRDELMGQWDGVRHALRDGVTHDGPTLWFEGILDDYDEAVRELSDLNSGRRVVLPTSKQHADAMLLIASKFENQK